MLHYLHEFMRWQGRDGVIVGAAIAFLVIWYAIDTRRLNKR